MKKKLQKQRKLRQTEFSPGAHTVTREGLLIGQYVKLATKRAEEGEDIILVSQLSEKFQFMIKRMVQNLYNHYETFVDDIQNVSPDNPIPFYAAYDDVPTEACDMLIVNAAAMQRSDFMAVYSQLLPNISGFEEFHTLQLEYQKIKKGYDNFFTFKNLRKQLEERKKKIQDKHLKERNKYKEIIEVEREQKKCIKMESDDDLLVDCTLQWLNMLTNVDQ